MTFLLSRHSLDPCLRPFLLTSGFVTTGLELWAALPCGAKHFRQRLWGTLNMPQVRKMPFPPRS